MDIVRTALQEDGAFRDITSPLVGKARARGKFIAKQPLVVCGLDQAAEAFRLVGASFVPKTEEGQSVKAGAVLATVSGPARRVLAGERVALNFLQQLSGVATLTHAFVERAHPARVYDTRKTVPGLRGLQKYAVQCGGGFNHRMGLHDGVMVKDNHIAAVGDLEALRDKVEALASRGEQIVIEAQTREQAMLFATFPVQVLMLDNFSVAELRRLVPQVKKISPKLEIEASGGVTLKTIRPIAQTGVDRISVGAITHSAPAVDISLEL